MKEGRTSSSPEAKENFLQKKEEKRLITGR